MGQATSGSFGNSCHCKAEKPEKADNLFAPIRGKMKVLKKIKKRMGLAPRSSSSSGGTNNLPPLLFNQVHGDNIRISRDGTVARRVESFCKGIAFSARPVKVNEKVCIKFSEISNNWSGVIRFGFTYNDPSTLRSGLPKYACPDLTNKPGYWAKALAERFCERDTLLFYYVNATGDVHFGINREEKGIFFSGVETRGPLWALIDVYGNSTAIEFVDMRSQLNNSRRNVATASSCDSTPDEVDRLIVPSMQGMNIQESEEIPPLRYQPAQLTYRPVPFHRTRGRNVHFTHDRCLASRTDTEFCQGYVFTARPLLLNERIVVQILSTESMYVGSLALGLTSCDPSYLQAGDLPDDSDLLLDRPEYWVVSKDFASNPQRGDEISFCVTHTGEVQISKNGRPSTVVMHVDQSLKLWAFLDIYGSTQRIRVLSSPATPSPARVVDRRLIVPSSSESMNSLNSQSEIRRNNSVIQHPIVQPNTRVCCVAPTADMVQVQPSVNGGAVLVVNLPPAATHPNLINHQHQQQHQQHLQQQQHPQQQHPQQQQHQQQTSSVVPTIHPHSSQISVHSQSSQNNNAHNASHHGNHISQSQTTHYSNGYPVVAIASVSAHHQSNSANVVPPTGTMLSTTSNTYIEPVSGTPYSTLKNWTDVPGVGTGSGVECTICYENSIDCVLYMCGHMCMCYNCAIQQWKGKGGGHCPLCRAVIIDVIRTYKS